MLNRILPLLVNKNYGKLLLTTISLSDSWSINFGSTQIDDIRWTMVDNMTNKKIAQGIVDSSAPEILVDLSYSNGDSSLYIDVDDTGNGVTIFDAFGGYKYITFLDIDILPSLNRINLLNSQDVILKINSEKPNNIDSIQAYYNRFSDVNFLNNATNTIKSLSLYINNYFESGVFNISGANNLQYLRIEGNIELDSYDFKTNNPLLNSVFLEDNKDNGELKIININDETTYINIKRFKFRIIDLDSKQLPELYYLYIQGNNDDYQYNYQNIINNSPKLQYLYAIDIDRSVAEMLIDSNLSLKTFYIDNNNDITSLQFTNNQALTDIVIIGVTNINELIVQSNETLSRISLQHLINISNLVIDDLSKSNLTSLTLLGLSSSISTIDMSSAGKLSYLSVNYNNYTKINIKNGNNTNLTYFSGHTDYVDAVFLVDDPTLPIFQNATFRNGDIITDDQATYDNA